VHEVERVFRDRMVNEVDMLKFDEFRYAMTKKYFDDCGGVTKIEERPLLFCSFLQVCGGWGRFSVVPAEHKAGMALILHKPLCMPEL